MPRRIERSVTTHQPRKKKGRAVRDGDYIQADGYCSQAGKRRYGSPDRAKEALAAAVARGPGRSGQIEVRYYQCPWCQGYHLTSQPEAS